MQRNRRPTQDLAVAWYLNKKSRESGIIIDALAALNNPNIAYDRMVSEKALAGRWPGVDDRAIADAHQSGLTAINLTLGHVFGEGDDNPFEYTVRSVASHDAFIRTYSDSFAKVLSGADILHAKSAGKVGLIYGISEY